MVEARPTFVNLRFFMFSKMFLNYNREAKTLSRLSGYDCFDYFKLTDCFIS